MKTKLTSLLLGCLALAFTSISLQAADKLKALIVDGQNNHDWKACTPVLKWILEDCGRFTVEVSTTPFQALAAPRAPKSTLSAEQKAAQQAVIDKWNAANAKLNEIRAKQWKEWRPNFSSYDVVVCNYNGESWPEPVRAEFVQYVRNGGGLVIVHAADNSFPEWPEYNEMIGVGGWGGRNEKSGPLVRWREGKVVFDTSPGAGGTHGAAHEFKVETREPEHPIMKGLPTAWRHAPDELYSKMRGPAKNLTLLATAKAEPGKGGTEENEPILMTISYGKGRVFHTVLGHSPLSMSGIGFQVTTQRGAEWAATGQVTLPAPKAEDLPLAKAGIRPIPKK